MEWAMGQTQEGQGPPAWGVGARAMEVIVEIAVRPIQVS